MFCDYRYISHDALSSPSAVWLGCLQEGPFTHRKLSWPWSTIHSSVNSEPGAEYKEMKGARPLLLLPALSLASGCVCVWGAYKQVIATYLDDAEVAVEKRWAARPSSPPDGTSPSNQVELPSQLLCAQSSPMECEWEWGIAL